MESKANASPADAVQLKLQSHSTSRLCFETDIWTFSVNHSIASRHYKVFSKSPPTTQTNISPEDMFDVNASCNAKRVYHFATKHIADTDHNITLLHRV